MLLDLEVVIINFTFDYNKRYEIPEMTLCNPNKKDLYFIKNIQDLKITMRFLNCSELSFTAYSEINGIPVPYFSKLEKNRLIHVQGFGYFVIQDYKQNYENRVYSKEITAYSAEYLLNNKGINLTFITSPDDSTKTYSKSYKFWDELDRYSSEPVSLLGNLFLIAPQWKIGRVSTSLWNQYRSFSESNEGLYGFLNNTVSESYSALFVFDFEDYLVDVYDTTEIIKKTDVMLTFSNLIQKIEIQELNNDIYTVLNVKGAENLSIARINPTGTKKIFKLDYYAGSLDENSENYYKNYKDWIDSENLRLKVLTWEKEVKDQMYNSEDTSSYGYLLEQQNQINLVKLMQESKYSDTKTQNESEQMLMSTYLDDQSTLTESGKTTMYNYHRKKQYAYEYNMNVLKNGGRLYDTNNDSLFDSNSDLGQPTGQEVLDAVSVPIDKNSLYSISALESKIEEIENSRENIVKTYGYEYYFTSDERTELEPFIREGEYQDSTFAITDSMNIADYSDGETYVETTNGTKKIKDLTDSDTIIDANYVAKQLLDAGYKKIETASVPSFSFSLDSVNFFFIEEFKKFAGQMTFGAMINVELEDGEWVYPYLQELVLDYENPDSFSITFGNRFRLSTAEWTWEELHNSTTNAVSSVNSLLSSVAQPVTNGTIDRVTSYINNTLIAANQEIQATSDNEFSFGGYGIRGRKKTTEVPNYNGYSGEQIWISNNRICFTDNGWNTSKMIFGKVSDGAYGVVADVLVGKLVAGNNLVISNSTDEGESSFYVDANGAKLTNSELFFQKTGSNAFIKINIDDGIVANDGTNDVFKLNVLDGTFNLRCSGKAEFLANSFVVDSNNFKVSQSGVVSATGTFNAQTSNYPQPNSSIATLSNAQLNINMINSNGVNNNVVSIGSYSSSNSAMGKMTISGAGVPQLEFIARFQSGRLAVKDGQGNDAIILSGDRTSWLGIQVDEGIDVKGVHGVQVNYGINCQNLTVYGSKSRIVETSYGWIKMAAFETPQPSFADTGIGICGDDGLCLISIDPRYAETISKYQELKWFVSPENKDNLWVEKFDTFAIVHGTSGTKFDWMCIGTQVGYENYAEISSDKPNKDVWKDEVITSYFNEIQENELGKEEGVINILNYNSGDINDY